MKTVVCDECAVALANDDLSGHEDEPLAFLTAWMEEHGYAVVGDRIELDHGYWNCPACSEVTIGSGVSVETDR